MQWDVLIAVFGLMFVSSSLSIEVDNHGGFEREVESVDSDKPIRQPRSPIYQGNSGFSQNESQKIKSALLSKLLLEWLRRKSNNGNNHGCGTNPNVPKPVPKPQPQPQPCHNSSCHGGGNTGGGGGNSGGGGGNSGGSGGNSGGGGGNSGGGGVNTGGNSGGGGDNYNNLFKNLRSLCFYFNKDSDYIDVDAEFHSPRRSHRYPSYYDPYTGCVYCDPSSLANKGQTINDAFYSPYWQPYQGTEGSYNLYAQNAVVGSGNGPALNNPGLNNPQPWSLTLPNQFSRQDPQEKSVKSGTPIIVRAVPNDYFKTKRSTIQPKSFSNYSPV